jgi:hypothetical protein
MTRQPTGASFVPLLNRARWSPLAVSRQLLLLIVETFVPARACVELILEFLSLSHTIENLLEYYPQLTREQIQAAINFARECVHHQYCAKAVS